MVKFTNHETAKKYESLVDTDREVHQAKLYGGLLSNITPEMAANMLSRGSNLVKEKPAEANEKPAGEIKADEKGDGKAAAAAKTVVKP